MAISYEDIKQANDAIKTTAIKGKEYAEVNQRIKAFRMLFPQGFITTEMISNDAGVCVFKASVGYWTFNEDGDLNANILGVGHAYEKEGSSFINSTSYIENCETSAVGRALGMAGLGIDVSVASYEEVGNAMMNQGERKATPKQVAVLEKIYTGENLRALLERNHIKELNEMSMAKASELISKLKGENK